MHDLEPFFLWRSKYLANRDTRSPFFEYENSEVYYTDAIYNHVIHPQWDFFGSETLYMKQLYADYERGFTILEFIGEWNDLLSNDCMILYRDIIEAMIEEGIDKFILIGENVFNFHADIPDYYQEWWENIPDGFIASIGWRPHVLDEWHQYGLTHYFRPLEGFENWRTAGPLTLYQAVESSVWGKRLR
jgi:hypothetical protein